MKLKTTIRESAVALIAIVLIVGVAYATTGSFTPPTGTTANYRTLGDIHAKLRNFSLNPSATHSVSTTTNPAGSFYTLGDIYGLLTAENTRLIPENIRSNVTIFGVTGIMVEGTPVTYMWEPNATSTRYCWDTASRDMGSPLQCRPEFGAVEYCRDLVKGGYNDWRLPTKGELIIALQINNESGFVYATFPNWSSTVDPSDPNKAMAVDNRSFFTSDKNIKFGVRCIRP